MATKTKVAANGSAKEVTAPVTFRELNIQRARVTVRGISSLIINAWSQKAITQIEEKQQKKDTKGVKAPRDPHAEFDACFYRNEDGEYCFPASGFKKAMVSAATSIDDKVNFPKTKIRQAVFVEGDLLPIIYEHEPNMRSDPVRLQGGTATIRYRPEFVKWSVNLDLTYNASVLSLQQLVDLINLAGFAVGVGEWRPEKDGSHGRFEVKRG